MNGSRMKNNYKLHEQLLNNILPGWVREYRFNPDRRWRADFCQPVYKIIVEIEGAVWTNGRHTRGSGFTKDMEKYNSATVLGYSVLRFTPEQIGEMESAVKALLLQDCERTFWGLE